MPDDRLALAADLWGRGLSVIPLEPRGKRPIIEWRAYQSRRATDDELGAWFDNGRACNIGIVTGAVSGIVVTDCDGPEAIAWADARLPHTGMITRTARGQHRFYRHPGGTIRNRAHVRTGDITLALDVRADGGYVVGPGSVHPSGAVYERVGEWPPIDELPPFDPEWIIDKPVVPPTMSPWVAREQIRDRARKYLAATPGAVQGQGGDDHTFQVCCRLVRGFDLSDADAFDLLGEWNARCVPPWPESALSAKIQGARKYGTEPIGERAHERPAALRTRPTAISTDSPADSPADQERRVLWALAHERAKREARRRLDTEERGIVVLPSIETLRQRLARPAPEIRWRIEDWQPSETRVMAAAQFKSGKTTLIANYIRSVADGDPFLGRYDVAPIAGTVALVDLEMSERQLDAWYRAHRIRHDDRVSVIPLRGRGAAFNLLDDEIRGRWAAQFRERDTEVLVLDCFRPLADALGLDEHKDAGRLLVAVDALLSEAGIKDAVIVHHMGHTGERSRGDSRLRDWPDVEWRLMRRDDDPASSRFVTAYGRDVDVPESQLVYESDSRRLMIADGSRRDAAIREALDSVLAVLKDEPAPQSGRAIKDALADSEHSRDTIDAALRYGVRTRALAAVEGPRRARLYRRVSGSVRTNAPDTQNECPDRMFIGGS